MATTTTLREKLEAMAFQWVAQAELQRLNKGQLTREKQGHEVLANCAYALQDLLAEVVRDPSRDIYIRCSICQNATQEPVCKFCAAELFPSPPAHGAE